MNRRTFLQHAGAGAGLLGFNSLLASEGALIPRRNHAATAKRVIWLFLNGGPSQVDTFDHKPALAKHANQPLPGFDPKSSFFFNQQGGLMPSPFTFQRYGKSGKEVSEIFHRTASQHVDDMAFIHSCYSESNNHSPALFQINSGLPRLGFPSMGSWLLYGLGSESEDLPGFIVMTDTKGRGFPKGYAQNWSSGFLPGTFQGTALNVQGEPINNLSRRGGMSSGQQKRQIDLINSLNRSPETNALEAAMEARIKSFELAFRMQTAAPEALDIMRESELTRKLYGVGEPACDHFAKQCLMARRLVERGVRIVQIYSGGNENQRSWDGHIDIKGNHAGFGAEVDQPIAGLLTDLKARGMLDDTLIICCGEFGRQPVAQKGSRPGRDHNPFAFTTWMAGGGVKGGTTYGATDEFGYKAVENKVNIHDIHATVLHTLGIDHEQLTYRFNGRDYRLTDVFGNVVQDVLA